ncbi:hypothetical protein DH2020_028621 [Rehmannia glutinosa]|uniref:Uncharacterized protein n=1 Tax=Rehmannia glutinosa TaxID=99300 RepID=A0ABR0VV70_REHGL
MARKNRGFRLGRKLVKVFKWCVNRRTRRSATAYQLLKPPAGPISKLRRWVHSLRRGASGLCSGKSNSGYIQIGNEPVGQPKLPKGHLLLREAEEVYGFDHPGRIQIPCPKSELENVQMKIAAASGGGIWRRS